MTSSAAGARAGYRHRRNAVADRPDPAEQAALAVDADLRSRDRLAEARTAGVPLLDRNGRPRSPITLPDYRLGRAPGNKGRRFKAEVLNAVEVKAILDALPARSPIGDRNRALIVTLWRAGLRVAEALALLPKDVDLERGLLTVLEGKGAKRRSAVIDALGLEYLAVWFATRDRLGLGHGEPVFCVVSGASRGKPMHDSTVREMLKLYARKAGVYKRVHPHGLRHTHAGDLHLEKVPMRAIQQQLGHEDLAMTAQYVEELVPAQLLELIGSRARPPGFAAAAATSATAFSGGSPVPLVTASPRPEADAIDPFRGPSGAPRGLPMIPGPPEPECAPTSGHRGPERVLDAIVANGGSATQAQLRRLLGLSCGQLLKHLHRLHERGLVMRGGLDQNRSVIWKVAPVRLRVRRVVDYRVAPRGEGAARVLDAVEALGGRCSQAELARFVGLDPVTVAGHCATLEADGMLERGGLDKTTSRRGSQVWRLPPLRARLTPRGGYSMRVTAPRR